MNKNNNIFTVGLKALVSFSCSIYTIILLLYNLCEYGELSNLSKYNLVLYYKSTYEYKLCVYMGYVDYATVKEIYPNYLIPFKKYFCCAYLIESFSNINDYLKYMKTFNENDIHLNDKNLLVDIFNRDSYVKLKYNLNKKVYMKNLLLGLIKQRQFLSKHEMVCALCDSIDEN